MSFTNYGLKMQAAAFQLQLAFDADDRINAGRLAENGRY